MAGSYPDAFITKYKSKNRQEVLKRGCGLRPVVLGRGILSTTEHSVNQPQAKGQRKNMTSDCRLPGEALVLRCFFGCTLGLVHDLSCNALNLLHSLACSALSFL